MGSEKKRQKRSIRLFVWVALLLLILISGSVIFAAKIKGSGGNIAQIVPTATAANGAKTPAVTPTVPSTTTNTATPTPTTLFHEDFLDNRNGWAVSSSAGYIRSMADNKLTLSVAEHKILIENVPTSAPLSNFTLDVSYILEKADKNDRVGLYLRGDSNLDHDYRIDIFGNNTITINKEYLDDNKLPQSMVLSTITKIPSIKKIGYENRLEVSMNGPQIVLKVNGVEVKKLEDYDYTKGQVALFVNNGWSSDEATASFTSMDVESIVDPLPDMTPTATPSDGSPTP
ncbi:hypothetical protein [Dictyobacter aurantiacus]|uniref:3-keto-disaccharide hydrolase domain-containing protein n=1 Tax=Dictyobacter aurantiacus TaxID=1936993 RepID=A0A401Z790_9CHLR|nr:hypothetical protein [Dictyobacter aurantiacus]GCE02721.1 hypothetical protein KDAU_00500 [Dictyobacter aurantiacus]